MGLIISLALVFLVFVFYVCVKPREYENVAPIDGKHLGTLFKTWEAFWAWRNKLIDAKACPVPNDYVGLGEKLTLSSGETLEGEFIFLKSEVDDGNPWVITGYKTKDGTVWTGIPEIPVDAHVKAFTGALSQPGMSSSLEDLLYSLAETGEVTADVTKLNGITRDRYMSEYFKDDMRKAWGTALLKVLEGAAERFTVDGDKPWLVTLYAPKEPVCS